MQNPTIFADVIVPLAVPSKYTYRVPVVMNAEVEVGKRALVQFGRSRIYTGIIYSLHQNAPKNYEAKYIEALLDEQPVVTEKQLKFWDWMAFYYSATPGEVMNAALPSGLKLSSTSHIQLNPDFPYDETEPGFFTDREHRIIDALHVTPNMEMESVAQMLEIKSAQPIVNNLLKKNALVIYEDVKDKYKPKLEAYLKLSADYQEETKLSALLDTLEKKAFKQAEVLLFYLHLQKHGEVVQKIWVKRSELLKKCAPAAIDGLVKKNILLEEKFETGRLYFEKSKNLIKTLSTGQNEALKEINLAFAEKKTCLLHGVTGSGKTEVYIELIRDNLKKNKQVLYLIPEIGLTTQLISRLRAVFGEQVGVYHSRFSENERVEIWNNVLNQGDEPGQNVSASASHSGIPEKHHYKLILGARSSLFLPYTNLGLIIVDEEHDSSFKQHDPAPRYHARDAALYLATLHSARVVLGSATPSVESFYNASEGKYKLVNLNTQFVEGGGAKVHVCDILEQERTGRMKACLTQPLYEAIEAALKNKEQIILFQNRRGFAPYTECRQCGHVPHCVQCDVSLIYHKQQQKLVCHYCGYSINPPMVCTACGSNQLHYKGMGTEKVEEDIEILFPGSRIARMDLDSTRSKYAYKQLIDDFEAGETDILIGTQMVTKGLDFNNVSVVGVLNADSMLNFPDFRSFERAFQLITQVKGRAGRSNKTGLVFIQTTQPNHQVLDFITAGNSSRFYTETLKERQQFNYPPFCRLMELTLVSKDINELNHLAAEFFKLLKIQFTDLLGPEFPMVSKIKNLYHKRILVKVPRHQPVLKVRETLFNAINELQYAHKDWRYKILINVDPA